MEPPGVEHFLRRKDRPHPVARAKHQCGSQGGVDAHGLAAAGDQQVDGIALVPAVAQHPQHILKVGVGRVLIDDV